MEDGDSPESSTLPNPSLINGDISEEEEEEEEEEEGLQNSETGYVLLPMNASSEDEEEEEGEEEREGSGSGGGVPNSVAESAPTPDDKGRSDTSDLPMEESQAEAIRRAMSGFSLGVAPPSWAQNLPEDVWKQELLDGIRKQKR